MIALDISKSMRVSDVKPDRLTQAKIVIYELLEAMPNERIGFIGFAGTPYVYAPLTIDHSAVREIVDQIDEKWAPLGGSDLAAAVHLATETLKKTGQKNNALVIISDGEKHEGDLDADDRRGRAGRDFHRRHRSRHRGRRLRAEPGFPERPDGRSIGPRGHQPAANQRHAQARGGDQGTLRHRRVRSGHSGVGEIGRGRAGRVPDGRAGAADFHRVLSVADVSGDSVFHGIHPRRHPLEGHPRGGPRHRRVSSVWTGPRPATPPKAKEALAGKNYEEARDAYHKLADDTRSPARPRPATGSAKPSPPTARRISGRPARLTASRCFPPIPRSRQAATSASATRFSNSAGRGFPANPTPPIPPSVPDLDRFDTIVKEALAKLRESESPEEGDTERIRQNRVPRHQLGGRRPALRLRARQVLRRQAGRPEPRDDDDLPQATAGIAERGKGGNRAIHAAAPTRRRPAARKARARVKVIRKRAKATRRATKNPATRARARRIPKTAPAAKATRKRTAKRARTRTRRTATRKAKTRTNRPRNAPTGFSRKTPISKKARSPPAAANSAMPKKTGNLMNHLEPFHPHPRRRGSALCAHGPRPGDQPPFHQFPRPRRAGAAGNLRGGAANRRASGNPAAQGQKRGHPAFRPRARKATGSRPGRWNTRFPTSSPATRPGNTPFLRSR